MTAVTNIFNQSELALAAYANLSSGISGALFRQALENAGFAAAQASFFSSRWRVIEQYNGEPIPVLDEFNQPTGEYTQSDALSVTVFEEISTGKRYLAVRGTQSLSDLWTDITDIAILGTPERQAQYASLKAKVQAWIANGTLAPGFAVTGHSLGGFLAGALLVDYPTVIEHAYLCNAPGVGGLRASLKLLMGLSAEPSFDLAKVSNLRADASLSPIAGLGIAWGNPISIAIENQNPNIIGNHSITTLTDALAVYHNQRGQSHLIF